jgi:hypothetical protein
MFRIRPDALSIGLGYGKADEVPSFRVKVPGLHVRREDEVPGFRVGQSDDVPGFRVNADGTVRSTSSGNSTAAYFPGDPHAVRKAIPVRCTSDGSTFGCTTPRGKSFSGLPAPPNFPARIASDVPDYHQYEVLLPPGTSGDKLMQGAIDKPTPGPPSLNRPATPEGTLNEATAPRRHPKGPGFRRRARGCLLGRPPAAQSGCKGA